MQHNNFITNKISYSLIEPQLHHCTPACDYKFHTLAVHPHPTLTAPSIGGPFGVRWNICGGSFSGNSQRVIAVGYFRRRAASWKFDRILNVTLPNNLLKLEEGLRRNFPPLGLYKGTLDSHCLLILLIYTKHNNNKMKSWAHPVYSFP